LNEAADERMTIRIEKTSIGSKPTLCLSGQLVSCHRQSLLEEVQGDDSGALDLEEVTLVDLGIVQLLMHFEEKGIELLNCPPYIREWISREKTRAGSLEVE
jgi:hypothetical protein